MLAPAVFAIPVLIVAEPYRMKRLLAFLNPWENPKGEGYQLIQSYYALGSGGFSGSDISTADKIFVPAVFGKRLRAVGHRGRNWVFGVTILAIIFIVFVYSGIKIAINAKTDSKVTLRRESPQSSRFRAR